MRAVAVVLASVLLSQAAFAAQPNGGGPPPLVTPMPGDENILKELMQRFQGSKHTQNADGIGDVDRLRAALCPICQQQLYKHADPNWKGCVPLDSEGKPRLSLAVVTEPARSPVTGSTFNAALPNKIVATAGVDTDFCEHFIGKDVILSRVWIDPDSGYAALIPADKRGESFALGLDGKPVAPELIEFTRTTLAPQMEARMKRVLGLKEDKPIPQTLRPLSEYVTQPQIPDWLKYDHAIALYERAKPPHLVMTRIYIDGAHACRRHVSAEVAAPALDSELQDSLSKAIKRMNGYMLAETLAIRRERGDAAADTLKTETDPEVLAEAALRIIRAGTRIGNEVRANPSGPMAQFAQSRFTTADMYLAHISHGGALIRLGMPGEAESTLNKALTYVPEQLPYAIDDPALKKSVETQLMLLRSIVEDRIACVRREQDWLFKAAQRNMLAIDAGQVAFTNVNAAVDPGRRDTFDAGPVFYQLGEILRRCQQPEAAAAWLDAAKTAISRRLAVVRDLEKKAPKPVTEVVTGAEAPKLAPETQERMRLERLLEMATKQRALLRTPAKAPPEVLAVIAKAFTFAGIPADALTQPAATPSAPAGPDAAKGKDPAPSTASSVYSEIKTRDELLKVYYEAILAYRRDNKNENPRRLVELVEKNYVPKAKSGLNEQGQLFCPEQPTKRLFYVRQWEPGDSSAMVIGIAGEKSLFGDGSIRVQK